MIRVVISLLLLFAVLYYYGRNSGAVTHPPGVIAPDEPMQTSLAGATPWPAHGSRITPLASFYVRARVLSVEHYWMGRDSDLSPVDLALGWGPMSDQRVVDQLSISQGGRWYRFNARNGRYPLPASDLSAHSANMHMIPSNKDVAARLKALRSGELVVIRGYLVQVEGSGGWTWKSSLSRTDTGNGACELVWVEDLTVR